MKRPLPNTYWVDPGRFLAGEHPAGDSESQTRKRLAKLQTAGIDCFVDLTQPGECPDYQPLLPASVRYYRHALQDHGVPDSAAPMQAVLATLAAALNDDRVVYLHCRAGIGRTGISVGCQLVEQGERPEVALQTLNTLWQQNERSAQWPHVPETAAQEAFILGWGRAVPRLDLQARARGALVGLAVGDALSAPTQGLKPGDFTPVTGMQGGGVLQLAPGQWSDDTSMALCLAESLIDTGVVDTRDQMNRYRRWLQEGHLSAGGEAVGVRPSVRRAVALAGWRRAPVLGSHDPAQLDVEPLGRCIAAALHAHADFDAAVAAGAEVARVTHQAPLVVDACRLFTGLLQAALAGQERESLLALAVHWPAAPLKPELRELVGRLAIPARRHRKPQQATILTLLEDVLRAFLASPDFATGLLQLVNQGGDSDVAGAAYGQLAGAARGLDAIPAAWRATLPDAERLQRFADQLLRSRGVSLQ